MKWKKEDKTVVRYEDNQKIFQRLPEIKTFELLIEELKSMKLDRINYKVKRLAEVEGFGVHFPVDAVVLGNMDPLAPSLFLVGGIHGLERIGSQVVLTLMDSLLDRLKWDSATQEMLRSMRLIFAPIMNPIGIYHGIRSNGRGVDLMRNAPVTSQSKVPFLIGGHRFSRHLPWYRGEEAAGFEPEMEALKNLLVEECFTSRASLGIDFHSGFGSFDQLWFPYAHTTSPFPMLPEMHALKTHFDESYPAHGYVVEPQALNYTTHGDLWDYLFDLRRQHQQERKIEEGFFLPLTLEMGSWYWLMRNPWQVFTRHGYFNPLEHKRHDRVLREHFVLFDFITKALLNPSKWAQLSSNERQSHLKYGMEVWYGRG